MSISALIATAADCGWSDGRRSSARPCWTTIRPSNTAAGLVVEHALVDLAAGAVRRWHGRSRWCCRRAGARGRDRARCSAALDPWPSAAPRPRCAPERRRASRPTASDRASARNPVVGLADQAAVGSPTCSVSWSQLRASPTTKSVDRIGERTGRRPGRRASRPDRGARPSPSTTRLRGLIITGVVLAEADERAAGPALGSTAPRPAGCRRHRSRRPRSAR